MYTSSDITGATSGYYGTIEFKTENIFNTVPTEGIQIVAGEKLIVGFGQNGAGWEYFELEAPTGTIVTIRHSEALCEGNGSTDRGNCGPEGSLYTTSNRGAAATTKYITSGNGIEAYHPTHTFYGFRYVEISATDTVTLYTISAQTVTSAFTYKEYEGNFSSGRGYVSHKLTVGDSDWLSIRAGVVSTEDGNAMSIQRVTSQKSAAPSTFKLYDPESFSLYTVTAGEKYTITFNYKLLQQINNNGSTKWDKVYFRLERTK